MIGAKNRRVIVQQPDGAGGFANIETVWASREFVTPTGPEALRDGAPMAIAQWRFVITYRRDLRAEWRVFDIDESRVFQVSGYGEVDDSLRDMRLNCTEIQ